MIQTYRIKKYRELAQRWADVAFLRHICKQLPRQPKPEEVDLSTKEELCQ